MSPPNNLVGGQHSECTPSQCFAKLLICLVFLYIKISITPVVKTLAVICMKWSKKKTTKQITDACCTRWPKTWGHVVWLLTFSKSLEWLVWFLANTNIKTETLRGQKQIQNEYLVQLYVKNITNINNNRDNKQCQPQQTSLHAHHAPTVAGCHLPNLIAPEAQLSQRDRVMLELNIC